MKNAFALTLILTTVGCSTFQPSTYENRSTGEQTVITATGRAADNAAAASTSHNCPTCTGSAQGSVGGYTTTRSPTPSEQLLNSATNITVQELTWRLNDLIREAF